MAKRKTHEQFLEKATLINKNIKILSKYKGALEKIQCECLICNYRWYTQASHILSGNGCPKCGNSLKKSQEQFVDEMNEINPNINIIGKYINSHTKIECQCKICGRIWAAKPNSLLNNEGCPQCKMSKGELKISKFFDENNIDYISQYKFLNCKIKRQMPFDFYLPQYNMCIEYDGELHYKSVKHFGGDKNLNKQKYNDNIKTKFCQENNIKLLRIPYWEFNNIEKILRKELMPVETNQRTTE